MKRDIVFGNIPAALEASKAALALTRRPTVAMVAQAAKCAIDVGDVTTAADYLQILRDRFPTRATELLPRLECRLDIARGRYEDALALLEAKVGKESAVYVLLRARILEGFLKRTDLPAKLRNSYGEELDALTAKLKTEKIVDVEAEFG